MPIYIFAIQYYNNDCSYIYIYIHIHIIYSYDISLLNEYHDIQLCMCLYVGDYRLAIVAKSVVHMHE